MNFIYSFQSEWLKKKRSLASWLVIIGAFFTPAVLIVARLIHHKGVYKASLSSTYWEHLWTNAMESMAIFLLPLGLMLAVSLITQLEFKNNTWKQVHTTPQKMSTLFFSKLSVIFVMMLQFFILFNIGIYLAGIIPCLLQGTYPKEPIPFLFFLKENAKYFIDCLPIVALQYLVGLQFKNFLVPVGGGIVCWILSIAVLTWQYGYFIPYTYAGLDYLGGLGRVKVAVNVHWWSLCYFAGLTLLSYQLFMRKREKG